MYAIRSYYAGLLREAVGRAFEDADVTWQDIDAVVSYNFV